MDSEALMDLFSFYLAALLLKMLAMSLLTARQRFAKNVSTRIEVRTYEHAKVMSKSFKVFANPEDKMPGSKVAYDDPDVERYRRAHLNDIENIFPFFFLGFFYLRTNPPAWIAANLIRAFAATRFLHTIVYVNQVPQPSRVLFFTIGQGICAYMAYAIMSTYW